MCKSSNPLVGTCAQAHHGPSSLPDFGSSCISLLRSTSTCGCACPSSPWPLFAPEQLHILAQEHSNPATLAPDLSPAAPCALQVTPCHHDFCDRSSSLGRPSRDSSLESFAAAAFAFLLSTRPATAIAFARHQWAQHNSCTPFACWCPAPHHAFSFSKENVSIIP